MKFARLFDLEDDNQLLLRYDYSEEDKLHKLIISTSYDNVFLSMENGFRTAFQALKAMREYSQQKAEDSRLILIQIYNDPSVLIS